MASQLWELGEHSEALGWTKKFRQNSVEPGGIVNYHAADTSGKTPSRIEGCSSSISRSRVCSWCLCSLRALSLSLSRPRHNPEDETHGLRSSIKRRSLAIRWSFVCAFVHANARKLLFVQSLVVCWWNAMLLMPCQVCGSYSVTFLDRTPIFDWDTKTNI